MWVGKRARGANREGKIERERDEATRHSVVLVLACCVATPSRRAPTLLLINNVAGRITTKACSSALNPFLYLNSHISKNLVLKVTKAWLVEGSQKREEKRELSLRLHFTLYCYSKTSMHFTAAGVHNETLAQFYET